MIPDTDQDSSRSECKSLDQLLGALHDASASNRAGFAEIALKEIDAEALNGATARVQ